MSIMKCVAKLRYFAMSKNYSIHYLDRFSAWQTYFSSVHNTMVVLRLYCIANIALFLLQSFTVSSLIFNGNFLSQYLCNLLYLVMSKPCKIWEYFSPVNYIVRAAQHPVDNWAVCLSVSQYKLCITLLVILFVI